MKQSKIYNSSFWVLWLVFALFMAAAVYFIFSSDIRILWSMGTQRVPEKFTELYFIEYDPSAKGAKTGLTRKIPFKMVNREGKPLNYAVDYQILENDSVIEQNKMGVLLKNLQEKTTYIKFSPKNPESQYQIRINVSSSNRQQSIAMRLTP